MEANACSGSIQTMQECFGTVCKQMGIIIKKE